MSSLFTRVFLAFWLALGLIAASTVAVTTAVTWRRLALREAIDPQALRVEAEAALAAGGRTGLADWLRAMDGAHPGVDIYIIVPEGSELLGRSVPERLRAWIARVQAPSGGQPGPMRQGFQFSASHLLASARIPIADDGVYTVAIAWFGSSVIDVIGSVDVALILLGFAFLASALVAWGFARFLTAPVKQLQASARVLAAGDLGARVDRRASRRRDELGALARDFDVMADRLAVQMAAKETLLRDVSHELRSPLARIRVALGLAEAKAPASRAHLARIERDVERMDALIDEILQLTRLSAGPTLRKETIDLAELVSAVAEDARLEAGAEGKTVLCIGGAGIAVAGDPELLRRAIENVVRNAVRFSPDGGEVAIETVLRDGAASVVVRDAGPGVPEADLARIFEPFHRVDEARDRASGGAGLGLAITARVLALHGGSARASNRPCGGLEVRIDLCAVTEQPPAMDGARLEAAE